MTSDQAFKKADRRIREVLKTYGYAPNNDLVNQLIAACDPVKQAWADERIEETLTNLTQYKESLWDYNGGDEKEVYAIPVDLVHKQASLYVKKES